MKKINKKIFPEDFFDLTNNQDELDHPKNKSKQKDHPKLLNPSNTIKIIPNVINEIKEEAFEESVEQFPLKKTNLKIIIPEKSNDELEPSTSGSSNVKLSPNKPTSPLTCIEKNKFNLYPENCEITSNIYKDKDKDKEEDKYKVTAHFVNEENNNNSFKEKKNINRPFTPSVNRYKNIYNPPLTCDNKNLDKFKFNYNFETKKNGVIVPKKDSKISQIQRQNLFKVGYNNNSNRNNKINNKKLKPVSSRIEQIFGTQNNNSPKNSSLISIKNNLNEKKQNKNKNKEYNTNMINNNKNNKKINDLKKANNCNNIQKNGKKARANSMENKYMNKKDNVLRKNESNKDINKNYKDKDININNNKNINKKNERKKNYSHNKNKINNGYAYLPEIKYANVKNQLEVEVNNLFQNLPEDFEKYPELKNYVELIVENIHGLKDYIYKNTQDFFKKNRDNSSKNRK